MLYDAIRAYPKNLAMEYFDVEFTYRDLCEHIEEVSQALLALDVCPNESVTICMPNMPEAIFLIYAINKIGAVCNVIHPLSDHDDIVNAVEATQSSLIFTTDVSALKVEGVKAKVVVCEVSNSMKPLLKTAYNLKNRKALRYPAEFIRWKDFLNMRVAYGPVVKRTKDDPAVIIYSGGTTGKSKGIVLSNLCFNALSTQCYAVCKEARAGNSILSALPIFHGFGLGVCIHTMLAGGGRCVLWCGCHR